MMPRTSCSAQREDTEREEKTQCTLCPRGCALSEGQLGVCGVRVARGGRVVHADHGILAAIHVDPIEKKPLHHYLPGCGALSLGSFGCNLFCRGCQNDSLSRVTARNMSGFRMSPHDVVACAQKYGCPVVAYTYNEPIVWSEFMHECAEAVHEAGRKNVIVTAGYVSESARERVFDGIDAANVDLKGFTSEFYRTWAKAELEPVLETLEYLHAKPGFWLEITTLLIPGINDAAGDLEREFAWLAEKLGPDVPLHLSAFHPACQALDIPRTPTETLVRAKKMANDAGLRYVYLGNVALDADTACPQCGKTLVRRMGYRTQVSGLEHGCCAHCGTRIAGVWEA